jgi:hypothetical protein
MRQAADLRRERAHVLTHRALFRPPHDGLSIVDV